MHRKKSDPSLPGHENVLYVWETDPAVETYPVTAKTKEEAFADFRTVQSGPLLQTTHEMLSPCTAFLPDVGSYFW